MNNKEMNYCKYDATQKGKGEKLAVFEFTSSPFLHKLKNVIQPFEMPYKLYGRKKYSHGFMICSFVSKNLPESIIYLLPPNDQSVQFCLDNKIKFVNFSGGNCGASDALEKELSKKAVMFTSAGNGYGANEQHTALNKDWITVAAVEFNKKGEIIVPDYLSYGAGAIVTTCFSNVRFHPTYGGKVHGTSLSSPMVMVLNFQYYANYKAKHNIELSPDYLRSVIMRDSEDILEHFKDKRSGYGIYKLTEVGV